MSRPSEILSAAAEWRAVPGMDNRFEASRSGEIRRSRDLRTGVHGVHSLVTLKKNGWGYPYLQTRIAGKCVNRFAHRMIAEAFLGPPPEGMEVAHLNGVPDDNRVENLAYVTHGENMAHTVSHGTSLPGERNPVSKLTAADVLAIRNSKEPANVLAERFGISRGHAWRLRTGGGWTHLQAAEKAREAGQ